MNAPAELVVGIVSVSDRASAGVYRDEGLPALREWLTRAIAAPAWRAVERLIPDEQPAIEAALKELVDREGCHLVLTTGGTGPAPRDVTPEATLAVGHKEMPGFGEQMRQISLRFVPTAILSRQTAVIRFRGSGRDAQGALIINLPGQEWMTSMTYQAASGAGANNMRELVAQMNEIGNASKKILKNPESSISDLDRRVIETMNGSAFPIDHFGAPLAGSLIPWIDSPMESGQTREEWKGSAETNKILQTKNPIPIDGICVRIGAMRCHSQALTIKLKKDIPIDEIEDMIAVSNEWVEVIPNNKERHPQSSCAVPCYQNPENSGRQNSETEHWAIVYEAFYCGRPASLGGRTT